MKRILLVTTVLVMITALVYLAETVTNYSAKNAVSSLSCLIGGFILLKTHKYIVQIENYSR